MGLPGRSVGRRLQQHARSLAECTVSICRSLAVDARWLWAEYESRYRLAALPGLSLRDRDGADSRPGRVQFSIDAESVCGGWRTVHSDARCGTAGAQRPGRLDRREEREF